MSSAKAIEPGKEGSGMEAVRTLLQKRFANAQSTEDIYKKEDSSDRWLIKQEKPRTIILIRRRTKGAREPHRIGEKNN